ncbi:RNA-directed DNA polymerase (Reverse transcriptase) [Trifolium medium]|uniref:RNA-directed DNA polymerase (Reverse transcriptase) n=1 Tax=Trifolium medium TaxID=97028 RepID=A0A392MF82_9FABA|nr:RNA-directed DNA polymerase (Reverse transcriptase) [Trifolium medium]
MNSPTECIDRKKIGAVAYRLRLPKGSKVQPVFHVSLLKKVVGRYHEEEELPDLLEEQADMYEPEAVLATRKTVEEATWEDEIMMRSQFPKFGLEDKARAEGGGIDRTQLVAVMPQDNLFTMSQLDPRLGRHDVRPNNFGIILPVELGLVD